MEQKFKIGDRVRYLGLTGTIGCIHDNTAYMSSCVNDDGLAFHYPSGGCCNEHKHFMGYKLDCLTLIEDNNLSLNIMSNIKEFAKDLNLSADERLLRSQGLKDECGNYTQDARDIIMDEVCKEKEEHLIEISKMKKESEK